METDAIESFTRGAGAVPVIAAGIRYLPLGSSDAGRRCGVGGDGGWGVGWYSEVPIVLEHPAGAWSQPEAMDCSRSEALGRGGGGGGGGVGTVVAV